MDNPNFMLWLAWACFGTFLGWLLWKRYLPAVLQAPAPRKEIAPPPRAWLFCEDGTALDKRVQWFDLRPGGSTVIGRKPRTPTEETHYVYLTADDIQDDHVRLHFDLESRRYQAEPVGAALVLHNNELLAPGEPARLTDGDTLDLGRISRFRFTLAGPEEE
jgi:hypothetical protein